MQNNLKYHRTAITINGVEFKGYTVDGLDPSIFRGLQVTVIKAGIVWGAYETTTSLSLTPPSWSGSLNNKTREGILQIVSDMLSNAPSGTWDAIQSKVGYDLSTEPSIEDCKQACVESLIESKLFTEETALAFVDTMQTEAVVRNATAIMRRCQ